MADEEVRITLRLPASLRDRLQRASELNARSMNGEIVATLERSYPPEIDADIRAFFEKWIEPITVADSHVQALFRRAEQGEATDDEEAKRALRDRMELVRHADLAARAIHPSLGVWDRHFGSSSLVTFGIRDRSMLSPETLRVLTDFLSKQEQK